MYNSCMPHALHDQLPCNRQSIDSMAIQFKLPWALPPVSRVPSPINLLRRMLNEPSWGRLNKHEHNATADYRDCNHNEGFT